MAFVPKDRRERLHSQTDYNGIDFVEVVGDDQVELHVHFLNAAPDLVGHVRKAEITGGETIPTVEVKEIDDAADWKKDREGRPVLKLSVAAHSCSTSSSSTSLPRTICWSIPPSALAGKSGTPLTRCISRSSRR